MKKNYLILSLVLSSGVLIFSCSSAKKLSHTGNKRKFFVQPVYLSVKGIEQDISIQGIFKQAFEDYHVKLITKDEMQARTENEMKRVEQRLLLRKEELKAKGAEAVFKAGGDELKYVSNVLTIKLELEKKDDSLMIIKTVWSNRPMPLNPYRMVIEKSKEINLANLSYSIRENIYSIVDSILYSNELK